MDELTKKAVMKAIKDNPDLPSRFIIRAIRDKQQGERAVYGRFRPTKERLNEISRKGLGLLITATDEELADFSE